MRLSRRESLDKGRGTGTGDLCMRMRGVFVGGLSGLAPVVCLKWLANSCCFQLWPRA